MGIVEKLKKEFPLQEEWLSFEIHPETPPEGVPLSVRLPDIDWDGLYRNLRASGRQYGISFGPVTILSNSRKALEASEFARDHDRYRQFHREVFYAYFSQTQDIGDDIVLARCAERAGLDPADMLDALKERRFSARLEAVNREARELGIHSAPTFIVAESYSIVGAQPLEVFREALRNMNT